MKLTKKLLSLVLVGAMALTTAACGGNNNNSGGGNGGGLQAAQGKAREAAAENAARTTGGAPRTRRTHARRGPHGAGTSQAVSPVRWG